MIRSQKGNVLVYILMAVALMAALAYAISRDGRGNQATRMDGERAKLLSTSLLSHMREAERVVFQMQQWGMDIDDLKFDLPGTAGYSTDVTNQVYHPSGGGLQVFDISGDFWSSAPIRGWSWQSAVNVDWSPTSADDLIFTFLDVNNDLICEEINERVRGSRTIIAGTMNYISTFQETATNIDFAVSECAGCEDVKSMCINNGTNNAFYTIIGSR